MQCRGELDLIVDCPCKLLRCPIFARFIVHYLESIISWPCSLAQTYPLIESDTEIIFLTISANSECCRRPRTSFVLVYPNPCLIVPLAELNCLRRTVGALKTENAKVK